MLSTRSRFRARALRLGLQAAAVALGLCLLGGCASGVPKRPVPLPDEVRPLPKWHPQQPWTGSGEQERAYVQGKVIFDTDRSALRPEAERVLGELVKYLDQNRDVSRVRLEGHTDARSSDEHNQTLSERRAIAVADWLVDRGLDHMRLLAVAFGETRPIAPNDTPAGMQENRRTEFHVAELAGLRFRGEDPTAGGLVLTIKSKAEREAEKRKGTVPTYVPPPFHPKGDGIEPVPSAAKTLEGLILPGEEAAAPPKQ
ncbi:MAG: OmpA family protein [Deltaproteobacteria bacterium]|nr:OmpA family protein [Deltaproteobacteria bacterium]